MLSPSLALPENYKLKPPTLPEKPMNENLEITYYMKTHKLNAQIA